MDGGRERKVFAPGYGEFYTAGGGDVEALAMAVPTDAADGEMPDEIARLSDLALATIEAAGRGEWKRASSDVDAVRAAWRALSPDEVPRLVRPVMGRAIGALRRSVETRDLVETSNHAIEVARLGFDLQLRYLPTSDIDVARLDLWAAQLISDESAGDEHAVAADAYALDYVRDRIREGLDPETLTRVNRELGTIQVAVVDQEPEAAAQAAIRLRRILAA